MSTFLGFNSALIPLSTSLASVQATFSSLLSSYGWQIVRQALPMNSIGGTFTTPANAFDMASNTASSGTVPVNLYSYTAAGFTPTVMYLQTEYTNSWTTSPHNFSLDYSTDGSSWTTLQSWTGEMFWTIAERRKYIVSGAVSKPYWRLTVTHACNSTTVYVADWQLEDATGNWLTYNNAFFDAIPPASETIGNSYARELARFNFTGTTITVKPVQEQLTTIPQLVTFDSPTAAAVTSSISVPVMPCSGGTASFATNIMTLVTAPTVGIVQTGTNVSSAGVAAGTYITSLASGTLNAAGSTYTLSTSPGTITTQSFATTVGSTGATASFASNVMTLVTAPTTGTIAIGQIVNCVNGVRYLINALASGTMNVAGSTYTLNGTPGTFTTQPTATYAPDYGLGGSASFATNIMTLTAIHTDRGLTPGQTISLTGASNVPTNTTILSLASGTWNVIGSTYNLSTSPGTIGSQAFFSGNLASYTGTVSSTAYQNGRGLFEVCRNAINMSTWNWIFFPVQSLWAAASNQNFIGATCKLARMNQLPASINMTTRTGITVTQHTGKSVYSVPMVQGSQQSYPSTVNMDLVNGFIYFLQVNQRGIALGTKTNAGYYTPIHICYGDNASAISQTPVADLAPYGIPCTPIELLVGTDEVVANSGGTAWGTHAWGVANQFNVNTNMYVDYGNNGVYSTHTHHAIAGQMQDFASVYAYGATSLSYIFYNSMYAEGLFNGADTGSYYSLHRLSSNTAPMYENKFSPNNSLYLRWMGPSYYGLDWYKYVGTAPANEQLVIGPSTDYSTNITTIGLPTDTTINVTSTTGFPSSGWLILEAEIIQYTGTTGTSFTGCVRGKYNTIPGTPFPNTKIYIGGWWVFIASGLVFTGYQIPT
jgi:hypothetical protein